ncbi:MAG TPA: 4-alpha-glucanotransferase [Acetobacteraceae bacterium]|jgi:glycogen debranching enzyme GlgX|nr:4-alpha-glucanotransferase [Acetobacteraceae bacterium]
MSAKDAGGPPAMGITVVGDGIDVAVHAPDAEAVAVCLFDAQDHETRRIRLPERTGPVHHGHIADVPLGAPYGLRAFGPWDPAAGLRFNGAKLLVDPWATTIDRPFKLHELLFDRDRPRPEDTASLMPKGIVGSPDAIPVHSRPAFDWNRQVIYELHVRGFTMTHPDIPPAIRGTFAALGHPASIAHLLRLGISTVELMPSAAWVDERHLPPLNLTNYWGYNPMAFLAPDPRLAPGGWAEVRAAVDALHAVGLNVILDVVLNHSGESDELGPTLSLRGLDNAGYYRLRANRSLYVNDAGCGNVLAMDRPIALRLGMDALRAWAVYGGLDGFRLDLAATLGRRADGFDRDAPFLAAVEQDPVLSRCVMIAEPWDIGPGGYQLGAFPARWGEWNDRFRDTVRRFWRGDGGMLGEFTTRFAGSGDVFGGRPLSRSVNYVTAHDGFTLADLVSYETKHNRANGEDNRDGTDDNLSWNNGIEGPSDDPAVIAARNRDVRALLATLLLSRGTPMLSMGDELGRTQHGNNNAYVQDNAGSWIDWLNADDALVGFTAAAIAVRRALGAVFGGAVLQGGPVGAAVLPDVTWCGLDGSPISDWARDADGTLIAVLFADGLRAALVFHSHAVAVKIGLPEARPGFAWVRALDSAGTGQGLIVSARSVAVFREVALLAGGADAAGDVSVPASAEPPTAVAGPSHDDNTADLDRLAELAGIDPVWWDVDGGYHKVSVETKRALLAAMRLPAESPADLRDSLVRVTFAPVLPPAMTVRSGEGIPVRLGHPRPAWVTLLREDGSHERFPAQNGGIMLPPQPVGRHRLLNEDRPEQVCHLTVAPDACYLPDVLRSGGRRFGVAAHLYALRSKGDQGIGDFTTLAHFAATAAEAGASMVGVNPLHALFPHDRTRASPYQPSDRRFLDPIYIDVSGFPGGAGLPSPAGPVDYPAVWERKRAVLLAAFGQTPRIAIPDALRRFATFETIAEVLGTSDWHAWPVELRHPHSLAVTAFGVRHDETVRFHAFMQTLADRQLGDAARNALPLGIYRDLAVGAAPDGAEAWSAQDTLMRGVSVGAPPDPFSAAGQVWSLPPPDPVAMRGDGFRAFNELLDANMRHAGALRIDHVMGLRRLFVVPDGTGAIDGAYVTYPMEDLLAQVALQSHRARCLVVGEDLGTVPEGMSDALAASNILSYSVLWFERRDGRIRPPPEWRRLAASCVSTHDLPTLAGWWEGADIAEKRSLSLVDDPNADQGRADEKAELIAQLRAEGLLTTAVDLASPMPVSVAAAVHAFVSATPSLLTLVQADDLAGEMVAVNLPGTDKERPNWRRRLDPDVSELCHTALARAILDALRERKA